MKLYKDGHEVYAEKEQVSLLVEDGWSKTKPEVVEEELEDQDEGSEETDESGESEDSATGSGKKTIRKPKKITK